VTRFVRGGIVTGPPEDGSDAVPAFISRCDCVISATELDRLARDLAAVAHKPPRLRTPLPRRVRARLAVTRAVDGIAIWLVDRGQFRAAGRLWHAFGMLGERSSR
jgi:hypothetical protein